ncbi:MAG: hypothetical protein ACYTG5_13670 [Planctomycetota bacterium]|jgi:hypothetical protein
MKSFALPLILALASAACSNFRPAEFMDAELMAPPQDQEEQASHSEGDWSQKVISPVSMPTIFESPVIQSELRPFFLTQKLPGTSVFSGGDFQLYAVQARFALTDKLALIATKDGFIDFNPDVNPISGHDESGWADIAAGLKYAIYEDHDHGVIVTPGLIYEIDSGNHDVWQGNGDGLLRPFVSAAWDLEELNLLGTFGYNQPMHSSAETTSIDYHLHADYEVTDRIFPLVEFNGIYYVEDANAVPFNFEGGDLINLGSANVKGNSVYTAAIGARFAITDSLQAGAVYEFPLGGRKDLLENRVTVDMIWTF